LGQLVTKLMSIAQEVIGFLNEQIQSLVSTVKGILGESVLGALESVLKKAGLERFDFNFFGVSFTIEYNRNYWNMNPQENEIPYFNIMIKKDREIDISISVASAPKTDYKMSVILVGGFTVGGIDFDLIIDPFLAVHNNIFLLSGRIMDKNGDGWGMELKLPECNSYKKIEKSIVVGPPTGITIPILGISVFPTIGVNLKYSFPKRDNLLINEFDYEKMEVYNPTSQSIDLKGWTVGNRNQPKV